MPWCLAWRKRLKSWSRLAPYSSCRESCCIYLSRWSRNWLRCLKTRQNALFPCERQHFFIGEALYENAPKCSIFTWKGESSLGKELRPSSDPSSLEIPSETPPLRGWRPLDLYLSNPPNRNSCVRLCTWIPIATENFSMTISSAIQYTGWFLW